MSISQPLIIDQSQVRVHQYQTDGTGGYRVSEYTSPGIYKLVYTQDMLGRIRQMRTFSFGRRPGVSLVTSIQIHISCVLSVYTKMCLCKIRVKVISVFEEKKANLKCTVFEPLKVLLYVLYNPHKYNFLMHSGNALCVYAKLKIQILKSF